MKDSPYIYDLNLGLEYIDPVSSLALPATLSPSLFAGGQFNVAFADGSYASVTLNFKDAIPAVPEPQQAWMLLLGLIGIYGVVKASGTSGRHSEEGLAR
jgi:prepilin-type processing-associated H-X9-DG protein